ncbi:hypothetical protein HDU93_000952 [Gonapodya sp. JEL0774]|nr:hypothetical protein HDU93_000952 [Gonapodya sp. JEL0774]
MDRLVVNFADITAIEKKFTAYVVPNAIEITTRDGQNHFFASFATFPLRDQAFDVIEATVKRYKSQILVESDLSDESDTESDADDLARLGDTSDDDDKDAHQQPAGLSPSLTPAVAGATALSTSRKPSISRTGDLPDPHDGSPNEDEDRHPLVSKVASVTKLLVPAKGSKSRRSSVVFEPDEVVVASKIDKKKRKNRGGSHGGGGGGTDGTNASLAQFPPPSTCACTDHDTTSLKWDITYPVSLPRLFNKLFGPGSEEVGRTLIEERRKFRDFHKTESWVPGGDGSFETIPEGAKRKFEWIVPLSGPIGPSKTRNLQEEHIVRKTDTFVTIRLTGNVPDVPSGDTFRNVATICLMHAKPLRKPGGKAVAQTRMRVSAYVNFIKSSWVKNLIESNSLGGLKAHYTDLESMLKEWLLAEPEPEVDVGGKEVEIEAPAPVVTVPSEVLAPEPAPLPVLRVRSAWNTFMKAFTLKNLTSTLFYLALFSHFVLLWRAVSVLGEIREQLKDAKELLSTLKVNLALPLE